MRSRIQRRSDMCSLGVGLSRRSIQVLTEPSRATAGLDGINVSATLTSMCFGPLIRAPAIACVGGRRGVTDGSALGVARRACEEKLARPVEGRLIPQAHNQVRDHKT